MYLWEPQTTRQNITFEQSAKSTHPKVHVRHQHALSDRGSVFSACHCLWQALVFQSGQRYTVHYSTPPKQQSSASSFCSSTSKSALRGARYNLSWAVGTRHVTSCPAALRHISRTQSLTIYIQYFVSAIASIFVRANAVLTNIFALTHFILWKMGLINVLKN